MITSHQRNVDQVNYQLRNRDTDLTLPKPKRELLKRSLRFSWRYGLEPVLK